MTDSEIWYDKGPLMSHNALFNWVLGARGCGKTFGFKKWCFSKNGETVWIRRYAEDIEKLKESFLTDMYQEHVITDDDDVEIIGDDIYLNDSPIIHLIALSTSRRLKSNSFANVSDIVFDEVIEEKGRTKYLKGELDIFFGLYETINRLRIDGRKDCRVFFLANKVSFVNPYFAFWHIHPFSGRFKTYCNGDLIVENYKNRDFEEVKKKSRPYNLMKNSDYVKSMVSNDVWLDDNAFIEKKTDTAKHSCNIHYGPLMIGLWVDKSGKMYCSYAHNNNRATFAPKFDIGKNEEVLDMKEPPLSWIMDYYYTNSLFFDDNNIKEAMFDIMQGGWKECNM